MSFESKAANDVSMATWTAVGIGGVNLKAKQGLSDQAPVAVYDDPPEPQRGHIKSLAVYKDELYAGGLFDTAGGVNVSNIAKWNGEKWSAVGDASTEVIWAMQVFKDELYASGRWKKLGNLTEQGLAKWDGKSWTPVGKGVGANVGIELMAVFGNELIIAGLLDDVAGVKVKNIAKWNTKSWSALGKGLPNDPMALSEFQNELYAGGTYLDVNKKLDNLFKWNGKSWKGVASFDSAVFKLSADTKKLYAVGNKDEIAGGIAQYDGKSWSAVGGGLAGIQGRTKDRLSVLAVINRVLFAGGNFPMQGSNNNRSSTAKWDGKKWTEIGKGIVGTVSAYAMYKNQLYAAGSFYVPNVDPKNSLAQGNIAVLKVDEKSAQ